MEREEFILPDWSLPDDPARPCRLWPSDDDGDDDDDDGDNDGVPLMRMMRMMRMIAMMMRVGGPSSSVTCPFSITRMLSAPFKYLGKPSLSLVENKFQLTSCDGCRELESFL